MMQDCKPPGESRPGGANPPPAPRNIPPELVGWFIEAIPGAAYVYDIQRGRTVHAGSRVLRLLGLTPEAFRTHGENAFADLLHPGDLAQAEFHRARLLRTPDGESRENLYRVRRAEGRWRTIRSVETPFERDPDGTLRTVLGIAEDVTDFIRESRRMKRDEELFRFLHSLGDDTGRDWQELIQRTLDEAVRITRSEIGYLHFVHQGGADLELFAWSSGTKRVCSAEATRHNPLERAGVWADTVRSRRPVVHNDYPSLAGRRGIPEGHVPLTRHLGVPILDDGRVVLAAGVGNKRDPYDEEDTRTLELLFTEMWRIVERRRADERMRHGAVRLREAERMETVARLAEGMAHALNNLLTPVQGFSEMLLESIDPRHPNKAPLEAIRRASGEATKLITHLLSYSGRRPLRKTPIEPEGFLRSFVLVARQVMRGNVSLELLPPDHPLPRMEADGPQLEQVLHNLALNASETMPDGGRITLAARAGEIDATAADRHRVAPGPCLVIEMRDEGRRPRPEALADLFEPFSAAGLEEGGRTLGLAASAGIVHAHGGTLEASAAEGGGTVFTLRLPCEKPAPPHMTPSPTEPATAQKIGARILVVDDEPQVLHFLRDSLRGSGYEVDGYDSPPDVERLPDETLRTFDVLITDVVMPGLNGVELATRLRARHPALRVILVTGYTERDLSPALEAPGTRRLYKPFGFRDLRQLISELTAERGGVIPS